VLKQPSYAWQANNMNATHRPLLANDSDSDETNGWNSTGTTAASWSSRGVFSSSFSWSHYATAAVLWILFIVGTIGNLTVLVVLAWRRSQSQGGTQLFVGSLASADIGLMLTTVWVVAYDELQKMWQFGVIPCKIHYLGESLTMNCSIWTLAALSIDR